MQAAGSLQTRPQRTRASHQLPTERQPETKTNNVRDANKARRHRCVEVMLSTNVEEDDVNLEKQNNLLQYPQRESFLRTYFRLIQQRSLFL